MGPALGVTSASFVAEALIVVAEPGYPRWVSMSSFVSSITGATWPRGDLVTPGVDRGGPQSSGSPGALSLQRGEHTLLHQFRDQCVQRDAVLGKASTRQIRAVAQVDPEEPPRGDSWAAT